jgi:hypothetical protein
MRVVSTLMAVSLQPLKAVGGNFFHGASELKITVHGHRPACMNPADAIAQPDPPPSTSSGSAEAVQKINLGFIKLKIHRPIAPELAPRNQTLRDKSKPYPSTHGFPGVRLNGRVSVPQVDLDTDERDKVVCRHFSYAAVTRDEKMSSLMEKFSSAQGVSLEFNSAKKFAEVDAGFNKAYREAPQGCKHLVDSRNLGRYLTALATALMVAPEQGQDTPKEANCMLITRGHAMSLHVERKSKNGVAYFTAKVYDPNETAHYKRVERPTPEALGDLTLASLLIKPERIKSYANGAEALSMVAVSMNHGLQPQMDRSATLASPLNMHLALLCGLRDEVVAMVQSAPQGSKELFVLLQAKPSQAESNGLLSSGLGIGLQNDHIDAVKAYIDAVLKSDLSDKAKTELLATKRGDGTPGLYMGLQQGQTDTVKAYVDAVLKSDLPDISKVELLAAKKADGLAGLLVGLHQGQTDTVKAYVDAVLKSDLPDISKVELLAAKSADGKTGLGIGLQNDHIDTVKAYVDAVLTSGLPDIYKDELIPSQLKPHET